MFNQSLSRRAFLGTTAAAGALSLAACNGGGTAKPEGKEGKEGGGVITAGSSYTTKNFNPSTTSSALSLGTNWHVVEGLYGINYHDNSTFPELAAGDPSQIDEKTFEIKLRKDAKFSTGDKVTPEDVIESFKRATAEGNIYIPMLAPIASVEKKDEQTLTVKTTVANFSLLKARLAIVRVVPAASKAEDMTAKPVGSGPWMYENISDSEVVLVPNTHYNGAHPAKDTKLHYSIMTDATARITAQKEGTTLVMEQVTADAVDQLTAAGCNIDKVQGFGTRFLMFDVAKKPWDNVKARQAIMYALDYEKMVQNAFAGLAAPATSYLPANFPNYHKAATTYTKNPEKAKALLAEAGVTPGEIELMTTDHEQVKAMATQIKQDLDALGFKVKINTQTSAATYAAIDKGDNTYDLLLAPGDPSCFGADPDLLMSWWYGDNVWMKTRCPWNTSAEWKKLQELQARALTESGEKQQATWNECFDLIAENCVLYPVLQVQTVTAHWGDKKSPKGEAIKGFKGIGTTGLAFLDTVTVK